MGTSSIARRPRIESEPTFQSSARDSVRADATRRRAWEIGATTGIGWLEDPDDLEGFALLREYGTEALRLLRR